MQNVLWINGDLLRIGNLALSFIKDKSFLKTNTKVIITALSFQTVCQ
jgi:hypothetical protein